MKLFRSMLIKKMFKEEFRCWEEKKKAASEILMKDPAKRGQSKIGKNPLFESARGSLARPRRRTIDCEREEMPKNRRRFESGEPNKTRFGKKRSSTHRELLFDLIGGGLPNKSERTEI